METAQLLPKMPTTSSIWAAYNLNRYFVGVALLLSVVIVGQKSSFLQSYDLFPERCAACTVCIVVDSVELHHCRFGDG